MACDRGEVVVGRRERSDSGGGVVVGGRVAGESKNDSGDSKG